MTAYMALYERHAADEAQPLEGDMQRYSEYIVREDDVSLMMDLSPWSAPDRERQDRLICFYVDPVPDFRRVFSSSQDRPESLKAMYVCMDPVSGALVPPA